MGPLWNEIEGAGSARSPATTAHAATLLLALTAAPAAHGQDLAEICSVHLDGAGAPSPIAVESRWVRSSYNAEELKALACREAEQEARKRARLACADEGYEGVRELALGNCDLRTREYGPCKAAHEEFDACSLAGELLADEVEKCRTILAGPCSMDDHLRWEYQGRVQGDFTCQVPDLPSECREYDQGRRVDYGRGGGPGEQAGPPSTSAGAKPAPSGEPAAGGAAPTGTSLPESSGSGAPARVAPLPVPSLATETPVFDEAEYRAQMDAISSSLAEATPEERWLALATAGYGVGITGIAFAISSGSASGGSEEQRALGVAEVVAPLPALALVVVPAVMTTALNRDLRAQWEGESGRIIAELEAECQQGSTTSCEDALRLGYRALDLRLPAAERTLSDPWLGPGDLRGPAFQLRGSVGYLGESVRTTTHDGALHGLYNEIVLRRRWLRVAYHHSQTYGHLLAADDVHGVRSFGANVGLQVGQGLVSPYLVYGFRLSGEANGKGPGLSQEARSSGAVVFGNTFDLVGVFSSRGPLYSSMVVDVALVLPSSDAYGTGVHLGLGWSLDNAYALVDPRIARSRPDTYEEPLFLYTMPWGLGVEIMRINGGYRGVEGADTRPSRYVVFSMLDLHFRTWQERSSIGISGWTYGLRLPLLDRRLELGLRTGLLGLLLYDVPKSFEAFTVGTLPTRLYARGFVSGVALEVGYSLPLFWIRADDEEGTWTFYETDPWPGFAYLGAYF